MKRAVSALLVSITLTIVTVAATTKTPVSIARFAAENGQGKEIEIFIKASPGQVIKVDFGDNQPVDATMNGHFVQVQGTIGKHKQIQIFGEAQAIKGIILNKSFINQIDISQLTELEEMHISYNLLTEIDISHNLKLKTLDATNNSLSELNTANNLLLNDLWISNNRLGQLNIGHNSELEILHCTDNHLQTLSLKNNRQLKHIYCNNNKIDELNISYNPQLEVLECKNNSLTDLDITKNNKLVYLGCCYNQIAKLVASENSNLVDLSCADNDLQTLNLSTCTQLKNLHCPNNTLTFDSLKLPNTDYWNINEQQLFTTEQITVGDKLELSNLDIWTQKDITIKWYTTDGRLLSPDKDYHLNNNKLSFLNSPKAPVVCRITHAMYGNVQINSTPLLIE